MLAEYEVLAGAAVAGVVWRFLDYPCALGSALGALYGFSHCVAHKHVLSNDSFDPTLTAKHTALGAVTTYLVCQARY